MNSKRTVVSLAVVATLYGCGGGGGGDGGGAGAPPELSSITESNATESVAVAYGAGAALFDSSATSAMLVKSPGRGKPGLVEFSIGQLWAMEGRRTSHAESEETRTTKAPVDAQESCENAGGTVRIVGDVRDEVDLSLSTGDHATITFSNCLLEGVTIDGQLVLSDIVVAQITSARFEFHDIRLSVAGDAAGIDGGFRLSMPTNSDELDTVPVALRDVSLRATANGQTLTMSDVAADTTLDFATGGFSYTMSGRVADSASGVSISLTTAAPFGGVADTLTTGDLTVEGAKASRAHALVSGPNQLTISVDADGDGSFEKQLDPVSVSTLLNG